MLQKRSAEHQTVKLQPHGHGDKGARNGQMMKVTLAVQNDAICPRLDCAQRLIVLDVRDSAEQSREVLDITDWPARGRAGRLAGLGVDTLVCGVLCRFDEAGFDASGVRLVPGVSGPIDAVVRAICSGTIEPRHDYWQEDCRQHVRQRPRATRTGRKPRRHGDTR